MEIIKDIESLGEAGFDKYLSRLDYLEDDGSYVSYQINPNLLVSGVLGTAGRISFGSDSVYIDGDMKRFVVNDGSENVVTLGKLDDGTYGLDVADGKIEGAWIVAKSITADQIEADTITAAEIEAGTITTTEIAADTITADNIAAGTITTTEIATDTITASNIAASAITSSELAATSVIAGKIAAGAINAANLIVDGTITADKLTVTSLSAISASLGDVTAGVLTVNGGASSYITIAKGSAGGSNGNLRFTGGGRLWEDSSNHMGLSSANDIYLYRDTTALVQYFTNSEAHIYEDLYIGTPEGGEAVVPADDGYGTVGSETFTWASIWAVDDTINTSDRRAKTSIKTSDLGLDFINALSPKSFKWKETYNRNLKKDKTKGSTKRKGIRRHYGLIAQDVEEVLGGKDFAGLIIGKNGKYGLRKGEFIAPMIKAIQELSDKVDKLEARLD